MSLKINLSGGKSREHNGTHITEGGDQLDCNIYLLIDAVRSEGRPVKIGNKSQSCCNDSFL